MNVYSSWAKMLFGVPTRIHFRSYIIQYLLYGIFLFMENDDIASYAYDTTLFEMDEETSKERNL